MYFFLILLLAGPALAESDVLDAKNGAVLGVGFGGANVTFPDSYDGAKKKDFDDTARLYGGLAQLGYDTLLFRRLVVGLRGEGFILDSFSTGNKKVNTLNAKAAAYHILLRLGLVFQVKTFDPVGDPSHMALEVFLEGGPTKGHRSFSKRYSPSSTTDGYNGGLDEDYKGSALAGGLNLTSRSGAFFEVKALYTSVSSTDTDFRGSKTEGGTKTDLATVDVAKKNFTAFFLVFGKHF